MSKSIVILIADPVTTCYDGGATADPTRGSRTVRTAIPARRSANRDREGWSGAQRLSACRKTEKHCWPFTAFEHGQALAEHPTPTATNLPLNRPLPP